MFVKRLNGFTGNPSIVINVQPFFVQNILVKLLATGRALHEGPRGIAKGRTRIFPERILTQEAVYCPLAEAPGGQRPEISGSTGNTVAAIFEPSFRTIREVYHGIIPISQLRYLVAHPTTRWLSINKEYKRLHRQDGADQIARSAPIGASGEG